MNDLPQRLAGKAWIVAVVIAVFLGWVWIDGVLWRRDMVDCLESKRLSAIAGKFTVGDDWELEDLIPSCRWLMREIRRK